MKMPVWLQELRPGTYSLNQVMEITKLKKTYITRTFRLWEVEKRYEIAETTDGKSSPKVFYTWGGARKYKNLDI